MAESVLEDVIEYIVCSIADNSKESLLLNPDVQSDIGANMPDVNGNQSDISVNQSDISVNPFDISNKQSDISENQTVTNVNQSDISVNLAYQSGISENQSDLHVNQPDIGVKQFDTNENLSYIIVNHSDTSVNQSICCADQSDIGENQVISLDNVTAWESINGKDVVREAIKDVVKTKSIDIEIDNESESDQNADIPTDENNNNYEMLTTDDEAEDFLKQVLRDSNGSDEDNNDERKCFDNIVDVHLIIRDRLCEKSLNDDSALSNLADIHATTSSEKLLSCTYGSDVGVKHNESKVVSLREDSDMDIFPAKVDINTADILDNKMVDIGISLASVANICSTDSAVQQTTAQTAAGSEAVIKNSEDINTCSNNLLDDTGLFKYDWSKCYNAGASGNRDLSTPDAEFENISPELFCLTQLSPSMYGSQRLYSRQTARSNSTLNTPDPIFYEDTDSTASTMPSLKYGQSMSENPVPNSSQTDINMNIDHVTRGTKRKLSDIHVDNKNIVASTPGMLASPAITNIMNQGRPPDISTWRTVSPSCDTQSLFMDNADEINGHWNKPTCTVPPFQNRDHYSTSNSNCNFVNDYGGNPQQSMYTATVYNPYVPQNSSPYTSQNNISYMPQRPYNQYSTGNRIVASPYQFTPNRTRNLSSYGSQMCNNGLRSSAAYRLDFSNNGGAPIAAPGMLNFDSHPPYLGTDVTRPQAVHATNLPNVNISTDYCAGNTGSLDTTNRSRFNVGQFRNYNPLQQCQSLVQQHVAFSRNPYMNYLSQESVMQRNPPSATQTFAESQTSKLQSLNCEITAQPAAAIREMKCVQTSTATNSNNNDKLPGREYSVLQDSNVKVGMPMSRESYVIEDCNVNKVGCDGFDKLPRDSNDVDKMDTEELNEKHNTEQENMNTFDGTEEEQSADEACSRADESTNQDKSLDEAVQSNEADSTTIDLTGESTEEDKDGAAIVGSNQDDVGSPTPADVYLKVHNKYFREIYDKKSRTESPITSFCMALDLSKKEEKRDSKTATRPAVPQRILPYGEPSIPISTVLNSMQGPTLAYNGAMLVPYMNSIFTAMANVNRNQATPLCNTVGTFPNTLVKTSVVQDNNNASPITQTTNLTLNQQVLMYSNYLQASQPSVATSSGCPGTTNSTVAGDQTMTEPRLNVNSIPLPLYAAPLQYPIRPLVPVAAPTAAANSQGYLNPYLYRFNIGVPIQVATDTSVSNATVCTTATDGNNNPIISNASVRTATTTTSSTHATKPNTRSDTAKKRKKTRKSPVEEVVIAPELRQPLSMTTQTNSGLIPAVGHNLSAIDGLRMSIQGSNVTTPTPSHSSNLTMYQPVPDRRLYNASGCQKKKSFKAKHFPFAIIQIGSYKCSYGLHCCDKLARVKFLFSKRAMVYEFQLESVDGSPVESKEMVEIEVPFKNIVSLWLYDKDMRVEVKDVPKICLGKKGPDRNLKHRFGNATVYNRNLQLDITEGQLTSVPYHYIQFRHSCADRIKSDLRDFDQRFEMILRCPLIEDPAKSLKGTVQPTNHLLDPSSVLQDEDVNHNIGHVYNPGENPDMTSLISCSCTNGCSAGTCQCCVKGTTCTEAMCECVNCRNPLNILHQLGLPADEARTDPCLMENIYHIKRLDCYVKTQLVLKCCQMPVLLFNCIPGKVKCASPNCLATYKYSWCSARLCVEDCFPRNHCVNCGRCTDSRNVHCQRCNICYFAGENRMFECPVCHNESKDANNNSNSSTDSEA